MTSSTLFSAPTCSQITRQITPHPSEQSTVHSCSPAPELRLSCDSVCLTVSPPDTSSYQPPSALIESLLIFLGSLLSWLLTRRHYRRRGSSPTPTPNSTPKPPALGSDSQQRGTDMHSYSTLPGTSLLPKFPGWLGRTLQRLHLGITPYHR